MRLFEALPPFAIAGFLALITGLAHLPLGAFLTLWMLIVIFVVGGIGDLWLVQRSIDAKSAASVEYGMPDA